MRRQGVPPRYTEGASRGRRAGPVGGRVHVPLHTDQRLHIDRVRDSGVLQPQGQGGADLRRHEQRFRVGKAAKVVHGREHRVHAADGTHTQLLQVPHGTA